MNASKVVIAAGLAVASSACIGKRGAEDADASKKAAPVAKADPKLDADPEPETDAKAPAKAEPDEPESKKPAKVEAKTRSGREQFESKRPEATKLETGDLVFVQSRSKEATSLGAAMKGEYNHVGIAFVNSDGPQIIAAEDSLQQLPYDKFVLKHGASRIAFKRLTDRSKLSKENLRPMQIFSFAARGSSYDFAFGWDDDTFYSSEYVHKAFAEVEGVDLGKKETLESLGLSDAIAKQLGKKLGTELDPKTEVVSPMSIFGDEDLELVWEQKG